MEGKAACHTKQIPEETLVAISTEVLGLSQFDEMMLKKEIQEIIVPEFNVLIFVFANGKQIRRVWHDRSRRESWGEDLRKQAREQAFKRWRKRE